MYALNDVFTPSFFMILGIVVLLLALLVVYFESKYREQNHKITSMLSLVSSLAEELNILRYNFIHSQSGGDTKNEEHITLEKKNHNELIHVSDDDDDDDDDDEDEDHDDDEDEDHDDDEDEDDDDDKKTVMMGKISISDNDDDEFEQLNFEENEDGSSMNIKVLHFGSFENNIDELTANRFNNTQTKLGLVLDDSIEIKKEIQDISTLEEIQNQENLELDYKKMTIQKLRSIVIEKGLSTDSTKLKKPDLLKLLESE